MNSKPKASRLSRHLRRIVALSTAAVVGFGLALSGASSAQALTTVDGSIALDLVEGSRLIGVESYHPKLYEFTAGPSNATVVADSVFAVNYNLGATFDPTSGTVFYLTGSMSGCALNYFDPDTSANSLAFTLSDGASSFTGCWGLTTLGGGTALLAIQDIMYDLNLTTGEVSSPRAIACRGSSMAYDPSSGDLYIGKNNGELYRAEVTPTDVNCTLVTTLVDVVDNLGENLKGFTFDTDGTLYLISRWAPQLFSLSPADLTQPINSYGSYRFTPTDQPLPIDSLVMIYTPLPEPETESPSSDSYALPTTGVDAQIANLAATIGVGGIVAGLALVVARRGSLRKSGRAS